MIFMTNATKTSAPRKLATPGNLNPSVVRALRTKARLAGDERTHRYCSAWIDGRGATDALAEYICAAINEGTRS